MAVKASNTPPQSSTASFVYGLIIGATISTTISFLVWNGGSSIANVAAVRYPVSQPTTGVDLQNIITSNEPMRALEFIGAQKPALDIAAVIKEMDKVVPASRAKPSVVVPVEDSKKPVEPKKPAASAKVVQKPSGSFLQSVLGAGSGGRNATQEALEGRAKCRAAFGKRQYLPETMKRLPPMFYTFPGAGNTWGRLLIEYATGIYTGSVYNDGSLLTALPGEFTCNWLVSVVKAHPHTHTFAALHGLKVPSDDGKCNKGQVRRFERAVLLLRDPYDSIWSEYQRRVSKSHVDGILKGSFDWKRWQANAASMAHYYHEMWAVEHAGIERSFQPEDYIYVKYEHLKDPSTRIGTLKAIIDFLRYKHIPAAEMAARLPCAFLLAESKAAHRHSEDKQRFMTKDIAYVPEIACRMWALFGQFASKHGYGPWAGYNCTGYGKIPDISVGPGGEIDRTGPVNILSPKRIAEIRMAYMNGSEVNEEDVAKEKREVARRKRETMMLRRGINEKLLVRPEDMPKTNVRPPGKRRPGAPGAGAAGANVKRRRPEGSSGAGTAAKLLAHAEKIVQQQQ